MMRQEDGAVLLLVLVGLALLAALAGMAMRIGQAGLHGLQAEATIFDRMLAGQSALAVISTHLGPAPDLPRDGTPTILPVDGHRVEARIFAAEGLVNPAHARLPVLQALLQAKGASPDQALDLGRAIIAARVGGRMAGPWDLAPLFGTDLALWQRVAPDLTFLGAAATVNMASAPPDLRDALAGIAMAGVDIAQAPGPRGLYEIDLRLLSQDGRPDPVTRHSVLQDRAGRFHMIRQAWAMEAGG